MPNLYKPTNIATQSWFRSNKVTIDNELNTVPVICFNEEEVLEVSGKKVVLSEGRLFAFMDDPTKTFSLLHPETDEVIGVGSYQEVYVLLYSLYKSLAIARDTAVPEPVV